MKILALDLSKRKTGLCWDSETVCPPKTGAWVPPKPPPPDRPVTNGELGLAFQNWLFEACRRFEIEALAYETPAFGSSGRSEDGTPFIMSREISFPLIGLAFAVEIIGQSLGIPVFDWAPVTCRKHFIGHGRPKNKKKAVVERCTLLGWRVNSYDEADAVALWAYAKAKKDKSFRLETATPLFAHRG